VALSDVFPPVQAAINGCKKGAVVVAGDADSTFCRNVLQAHQVVGQVIGRETGPSGRALLALKEKNSRARYHFVSGSLSDLDELASGPGGSDVSLYFADWVGNTPDALARAQRHCKVRPISVAELAELMNVTHLTAVMDCVAWKK